MEGTQRDFCMDSVCVSLWDERGLICIEGVFGVRIP